MRRCPLLVLLFLAVSAFAADAPWRATKLLSVGDKLPDDAGLQVQEIGDAYWSPPGMVVAWVRVGVAENAWMLVSIKGGKVKSIIREGKESISRYAAADAKPMRILHDSKWLGVTSVVPGRDRVFIAYTQLQTWDGEALHGVASPGDELRLGQTAWRLSNLLALMGRYEDGGALLWLGANAPRKSAILALYDGKSYTPLLVDGDSLPGMPSVRMTTNVYNIPIFSPARGGAFVKMRVAGAEYRDGLFWVEPGRAELIAPYGFKQHSLLGPEKETFDVGLFATPSTNIQALSVVDGKSMLSTYVLRRKGEIKEISYPRDKPGRYSYFPGVFISEDPPAYLFASVRNTTKDSEGQLAKKEEQKIFDSYWLAGADGKAREIAQPPLDYVLTGFKPTYRKVTDPYRGVLVLHTAGNDWAKKTAAQFKVEPKLMPAWFLADGGDAFVVVPDLATDSGPIPLDAVVGFVDARHGFARMGNSLVAIER